MRIRPIIHVRTSFQLLIDAIELERTIPNRPSGLRIR